MQIAEGEFQRLKPSLLYRCSLVAVSVTVVFLPLLYLAMVGFLAWGILFYAVHATVIFKIDNHWLLIFCVYFAPIFAGLVLLFFLVKPLFVRNRRNEESFSLNHADAPELFALIGSICRALNAPIPSRVDVDCSVNAMVRFRGGWRSLFGNDLMLCIGLPLVAGMNRNQFAGIIAHEYGHFSQGTAMRAQYIISSVNRWFYRIVYERDAWDDRLIDASDDVNAGVAVLIVWFARAGVGFGRSILWVFMMISGLLSSYMSRQMEFDADQYEIKMSGSDTFISTARRMQQLNLGLEAAWRQVASKWKNEKKLFDQIPDFIAGRANEIAAETQERHYTRAFKRRTGAFDSHPSDAARMQRARAAAEPGIFHDSAPATTLFADFPGLSRRWSLFYYERVIGPQFSPDCLVSMAQMVARADHNYDADREKIRAYLPGVMTESRPLIIKENKSLLVRRQEILVAELLAYRRQMEESQPAAEMALVEFLAAETQGMQAGQASLLLQAGFQFDPAEFGLPDNEIEPVQSLARQTAQAAGAELQKFENAAKTRLTTAFQLLRSPQIVSLIPDAQKLHDEAHEMIWVLSRLADVLGPVCELRKDCATLEVLLEYRRQQPAADNVVPVIETIATGIQDKVNAIQSLISQIRYPFHHTTEHVMMSEYARNKEYHADPFELALREARSHSQKLLDLHARLLARLIESLEVVEIQAAALESSEAVQNTRS